MNDQILFYLAITAILLLVFNKIVIEDFGDQSSSNTNTNVINDMSQTVTNAVINASNTAASVLNNLTVECSVDKPCSSNKICQNGKCI
jgi:hypothetical protein